MGPTRRSAAGSPLVAPPRRRSSTCRTPRLIEELIIPWGARAAVGVVLLRAHGVPRHHAGHRPGGRHQGGSRAALNGHSEPLEAADRVRSAVAAIPVVAELPIAQLAPLAVGPPSPRPLGGHYRVAWSPGLLL